MGTRVGEDQIPTRFRDVLDEQVGIYDEGRSIDEIEKIPDTPEVPIEEPGKWLRIPDVICVFVDMKGSTKLSAVKHDKSTAGAYQLYTGTAVRLFSAFEAPYIDVRGDGVFALFDQAQPYRALASAVSFKTFAEYDFVPTIRSDTGVDNIGSRIGMDQRTVLVRKLGFKRHRGRTDRQNEVWAGRPVNMAAKLCSIADDGQLLVSDRFFKNLEDDRARYSCGCSNGSTGGTKSYLWKPVDLSSDDLFDFDEGFALGSYWCERHGNEYCEAILALDE